MPAARLQHVEMADHVGLDIGLRIGQRIAHAGLCGQMDDPVDLVGPGQQLGHRPRCGNVALLEAERFVPLQALKPSLLEADVVIGIEIVEADHTARRAPRVLRTNGSR